MRVYLIPMQLPEKIVLAMLVWVALALVISFDTGLEMLLTLTVIGVLVVRE